MSANIAAVEVPVPDTRRPVDEGVCTLWSGGATAGPAPQSGSGSCSGGGSGGGNGTFHRGRGGGAYWVAG